MKKLILFILLVVTYLHGNSQKNYWQQQVNYTIDVTLNDVENTLNGNIQIQYSNHSPDTLSFIWFHVWPNAYKNDKTALTDQFLTNGNTAFYFAEENKRGYINQLNFKVNNSNAITEDHPTHQDIIKLLLPKPIAPGETINITTPFRVKLPYNFSRGGHVNQSYQITQWYPKPAVYDATGWHEMPYLDQGEFYSEFGNYDIKITTPKNYVIAATGELQNTDEKNWLKEKVATTNAFITPKNTEAFEKIMQFPASSNEYKTLQFVQNNVHDFAWFADKRFLVMHDTIQLKSGKNVDAFCYVLPNNFYYWSNSLQYTKNAIRSKSEWIGEYPFNVVHVVDNAANTNGGMEYPTITLLTAAKSKKILEDVINHEVGHNWFYGILASNERDFPWLDEGFNTYYDNRYNATFSNSTTENNFSSKKIPDDFNELILASLYALKRDQPINTAAEKMNNVNYNFVTYGKTAKWLALLEQKLGKANFDILMQTYYSQWKFKHPSPADFKHIADSIAGIDLKEHFALLNQQGPLVPNTKKQLQVTGFFNLKNTDKKHYISILPAIGANYYDKLMVGTLIHNYNLPPSKFQFLVAPLYATGTKKLNGIAKMNYKYITTSWGNNVNIGVNAASFSYGNFKETNGNNTPLKFSKIVPTIRYNFLSKNPLSKKTAYIQFKSFFIRKTNVLFKRDDVNNVDIITYPITSRTVNQLQLGIANNRILYPYQAQLQAEQGDGFVRLAFTGNYYFNYAKGGGLQVRFFAGKFIYTVDKTFINQFKTEQYHLNLTGPKGSEDYTYENYFIGRSEFDGYRSQQIMNRDGFFKVRTDLLSSKIGKTDDWLSTINLTTDVPKDINPLQLLPIKIPLKVFVDIGSYAEAWKQNNNTSKVLYDAGLQVSLLRNCINVYIPLLYSKQYSDYFKSTIPEKRFLKNIAFTIDVQNLSLRKFVPAVNF